jgi:hypothetical protein
MNVPPLNPNLLYDDKIQSPRLKDIYHEINLAKALGTDKLINTALKRTSRAAAEKGITEVPKQYIGFFIPLDAYLPLPEPYIAEFIAINEVTKKINYAEINIVTGCEVKVNINDQENQCRLSVIMASISLEKDLDLNKVEPELLHKAYIHALANVNKIISAYKLTPFRHNHDLSYVNASNRDSDIQVIVFRNGKDPVKQSKSFQMQSNTFASIAHSREMLPQELNYFRISNYELDREKNETYDIVKYLIAAIDANCNGDFEVAVVNADKFTELFMKFLYFHLLLYDNDVETAFAKTNRPMKIDILIKNIARIISIKPGEFRSKIHAKAWEKKCRDIRNTLNHNFLKYEVKVSTAKEAINASIKLVVELAGMVEGENQETTDALHVFKNLKWLLAAQDEHTIQET